MAARIIVGGGGKGRGNEFGTGAERIIQKPLILPVGATTGLGRAAGHHVMLIPGDLSQREVPALAYPASSRRIAVLLVDALAAVGQAHRRGQSPRPGGHVDRFAGGQSSSREIGGERIGFAKAGDWRVTVPGERGARRADLRRDGEGERDRKSVV